MENVLNDTQAGVVDPKLSDANVTGASVAQESPEGQTAVTTGAVAKPQQSEQDNAKFAEMRRENERLAKELADEKAAKAAYSKLTETISDKLGYKGATPDDVRIAILAEQQGKTPEEVKAQEEHEAQRVKSLLENDPDYVATKRELDALKAKAERELLQKDLAEIKASFPNETAADCRELGEKFLQLRALGFDTISAYVAVKGKAVFETQTPTTPVEPPPPEPGAVNGAADYEARDYLTDDEIKKLTPAELKNPETRKKAWNGWMRLSRKQT